MKRLLILLLLLFPSSAYAQLTVPQGGTGTTTIPQNYVLIGGSSPLRITAVSTSSLGITGQIYTGTYPIIVTSSVISTAISSSTLTASSPLTGSFAQIGTGGSLGCQIASGSQAGCLSSADWTTFNNKGNGTWPFTPAVNYGVNVQSTSTPIFDTQGFQASSTSYIDRIVAASSTASSFANASSTLFTCTTCYVGATGMFYNNGSGIASGFGQIQEQIIGNQNEEGINLANTGTGGADFALYTTNNSSSHGHGFLDLVDVNESNIVMQFKPAALDTLVLPTYGAGVLHTDSSGNVTASSVSNGDLANSSVTINTAAPLGGGGALSLGGTLNLTCSTCSTISTPVSIANGGTATTTQVTGGVNYFDGTHITSGTALTFTGTNLGIGTTSPNGIFSIQTNTAGNRYITFDDGGINGTARPTINLNGGSTAGFLDIVPGGSMELVTRTASNLSFGTANGINMTIQSGGNVGIGTTNPNATLAVNGTASTSNLTVSDIQSALLLNGSTGVTGAYAGTSCTNQFVRSENGAGVATCSTVSLTADITGTLAIGNGGTGAATFGQGWIFSSGGTNALAASTSPTVNYITATSTTATSTYAYSVNAQTGGVATNGVFLARPAAIYATSTPGANVSVVFSGARDSAPSYSAGVLTFPSNTKAIDVKLWGGAGGGGSGAAGATVGLIGNGGSQSCFGTNTPICPSALFAAQGGLGGVAGAQGGSSGGQGGAASSTANIAYTGNGGGTGTPVSGTFNNGRGAPGGAAPQGAGGGSGGQPGGAINGVVGGAPGGGGGSGGGIQDASTQGGGGGGGGSGGFAESLLTPSGSQYYYTIGAGGTGGAAVVSTNTSGAGGNGASGGILFVIYTY